MRVLWLWIVWYEVNFFCELIRWVHYICPLLHISAPYEIGARVRILSLLLERGVWMPGKVPNLLGKLVFVFELFWMPTVGCWLLSGDRDVGILWIYICICARPLRQSYCSMLCAGVCARDPWEYMWVSIGSYLCVDIITIYVSLCVYAHVVCVCSMSARCWICSSRYSIG